MRTKEIIVKSAFELFCEKPFSSISVQNIIDRAGCSRYSFYKYFTDKYELMHLYYQSSINAMLINQYNGNNFISVQADIFQFIKDNANYFSNVKEYQGSDSFWDFLTRYTWTFFTAVKCENSGKDSLSVKEKIEMHFVVEGAVSVFKKYVDQKALGLPPMEISELLCTHYPDDYYILPYDRIDGFLERVNLIADSNPDNRN